MGCQIALPGTSLTETSFQKRFFIALPGFIWLARRSCPRLSSSACLRRLSTRSPYCDAAGRGGCGGGPAVVVGSGTAGLDGVVCRHLGSGVRFQNEVARCGAENIAEGEHVVIRCMFARCWISAIKKTRGIHIKA